LQGIRARERKDAKKRIGELAAPDEVGAAVKAVTDATLAAVGVIIAAGAAAAPAALSVVAVCWSSSSTAWPSTNA
jgi:hypothetical protein